METYGTYNGIKFLMDGSMELSFLVPHHEKSRLLASIDEITQAGLPTLEITAKKKRKKRSLDANDYLWGALHEDCGTAAGQQAQHQQGGGLPQAYPPCGEI